MLKSRLSTSIRLCHTFRLGSICGRPIKTKEVNSVSMADWAGIIQSVYFVETERLGQTQPDSHIVCSANLKRFSKYISACIKLQNTKDDTTLLNIVLAGYHGNSLLEKLRRTVSDTTQCSYVIKT